MRAKHSSPDIDPELEALVRTNTVITLASMQLAELVDVAERYRDNPFICGLVGEAAIAGLVDVAKRRQSEGIATARGQRDFGLRVGLLGAETTYQYLQAFGEGRSDFLPPQF